MSIELVVDNGAAVKAEALTWPERAKALKVTDGTTYTSAAETLQAIKALRTRIGETFDPHIKRAHESHRALLREKQDAEAPLLEAESLIKRTLSDYQVEQERIRREEERRQQEEARKAEEARRLEEAASLEREAQATDDAALLDEAMAMLDAPMAPMPISLPRATPKVSGIVHRENWSARVTSLIALVRFVAAHPEHVNLLTANQTALNGLARSMKQNLKVDGVQAVNTPTVAASGR